MIGRRRSRRSEDLHGVERVLDVLLNPLDHDDFDEWRHGVMHVLRPLLGADMLSFQAPHPGHELFVSDIDRQLVRTYTTDFIPYLDKVKNYSTRMIHLGVGNRAKLWGADLPWLYRSAYYNECIVPMRAFGPTWTAAAVPGEERPAILLAHVDRRYGRRLGRRELGILRVLRPALAAAMGIVKRFEAHRATLETTVDAVGAGVMVYSADGHLLHENPEATRLLEAAGPHLVRRCARQVARAALSVRAWMRALRSPEHWRRTRHGRLTLRACRVAPAEGVGAAGAPAVVVLVEEERRGNPGLEEIRIRHRLTRRQAEVATLLAERATNAEIAKRLRISPATARHHTEAVMGALGVKSRREVAGKLEGEERRVES